MRTLLPIVTLLLLTFGCHSHSPQALVVENSTPIVGASRAAKSRAWVTLTNCQYVATKAGDGDSFRVRSGTNEFSLRLYYVDAPEATLTYPERVRLQSEHFGITLDATLKAGARARERTQELLREPFVVRTRWASAAGRGRETRYYGIVEVGGKSLAEVLVSEGLAQTKGVAPNLPSGEKASAYMKRLEDLEREARQKRLGAWGSAPEEKKEKTEK
ncbi:MAG: thermonuclease family protein [Verrucomicrobiota bacterium]